MVRRRIGDCQGGGVVLHHFDPDAAPAETRFEYVWARKGRRCRRQELPRKSGKSNPLDCCSEGQLVHSQSRTRLAWPGVSISDQVQHALEGAVLTRTAMCCEHDHGEI